MKEDVLSRASLPREEEVSDYLHFNSSDEKKILPRSLSYQSVLPVDASVLNDESWKMKVVPLPPATQQQLRIFMGVYKLEAIQRALIARKLARKFYTLRFLTHDSSGGAFVTKASTYMLEGKIKQLSKEVLELHEENTDLTHRVEQSTQRLVSIRTPTRPFAPKEPCKKSHADISSSLFQGLFTNKFDLDTFQPEHVDDLDLQHIMTPRRSNVRIARNVPKTSAVANIPWVKCNFEDAIKSIAHLLSVYRLQFQQLFTKYSIVVGTTSERKMFDDAWLVMCKNLGFLTRLSRRRALESFLNHSLNAVMKFPGFLHGLLEIAQVVHDASNENERRREQQKKKNNLETVEPLLMLMVIMNDNFKCNSATFLFPDLHTHVVRWQLRRKQLSRSLQEHQVDEKTELLTYLVRGDTSAVVNHDQGQALGFNLLGSVMDCTQADYEHLCASLDNMLGAELNNQLLGCFQRHATFGDSNTRYLTFVKFHKLYKCKVGMKTPITVGVLNLVYGNAIQREKNYLIRKKQQEHPRWHKPAKVSCQRMSFPAFKIALAELAQRDDSTRMLSNKGTFTLESPHIIASTKSIFIQRVSRLVVP